MLKKDERGFFFSMLKRDGREFFFSMLKRDERGFFFYKFMGGWVKVGLIN